jgi:hypothetical protein
MSTEDLLKVLQRHQCINAIQAQRAKLHSACLEKVRLATKGEERLRAVVEFYQGIAQIVAVVALTTIRDQKSFNLALSSLQKWNETWRTEVSSEIDKAQRVFGRSGAAEFQRQAILAVEAALWEFQSEAYRCLSELQERDLGVSRSKDISAPSPSAECSAAGVGNSNSGIVDQNPPKFPKRAAWLKAQLRKREITASEFKGYNGPDPKTTKKILDGLPVREIVLDKVASALSTHPWPKIDRTQIPDC